MENNTCKVLGITKRTYTEGKNAGKTGVTYHLQGSFSDYDIENSNAEGVRVFNEFSYKDFNLKVGDQVAIVYGKGFQDKATLENMIPVPFDGKSKTA
jgi:hypothetical protein